MDKLYVFFVFFLVFFCIWMIAGVIGAWRYHQGHLRERYTLHGYTNTKCSREEFVTIIFFHLLSSFGGFVILYLYETTGKNNCWYHNCKKQ